MTRRCRQRVSEPGPSAAKPSFCIRPQALTPVELVYVPTRHALQEEAPADGGLGEAGELPLKRVRGSWRALQTRMMCVAKVVHVCLASEAQRVIVYILLSE